LRRFGRLLIIHATPLPNLQKWQRSNPATLFLNAYEISPLRRFATLAQALL
jgi:hypothetical protein